MSNTWRRRNTLGDDGINTSNTRDNTVHNTHVAHEPHAKYTPDAEVLRARAAANPLAHASSLREQMQDLSNGPLRQGLSKNQLAARAWYSCNGDLERRHTTGVYLRAGRGAAAAPVLGVYVDSHACLSDFSMRQDIYLVRLAAAGLQVSGIEFRLSRREYISAHEVPAKGGKKPQERRLLAPLSSADRSAVAQIASELSPRLPETLRAKVSRVVELSLSREKARTSQK